ncbi:MAG: hydroxymethylbilane synthase [Abditibacteriota bacterium]|nr:hydroxymethylbilane synthase [Abditibacteriota bacterium]
MGTRGSALALAQSRQVARELERLHPGLLVSERIIRTTGDQQQSLPLPEIGGKGVFTLEIEQALLSGEIDFAVHSLKDLPPLFPAGLCLAAVPAREDAGDCMILHPRYVVASLDELPTGARVGTSSLRRAAQLKALRPDLETASVRGNIDTRLKKLESENFDAIVLARAGLNRLDIAPRLSFDCDQSAFVPAPGQGALAIEARSNDMRTLELLAALDHAPTRREIEAERAVMEALGAGCSTPLGARAIAEESALRLWAVVLSPDGKQRLFAQHQSTLGAADALGRHVAALLKEQGAAALMESLAE